MSRINGQVDQWNFTGSTGWALYDWNYSADRPTFAFIAGNPQGARVQLNRYRRCVQLIGTRSDVLIFSWSAKPYQLIFGDNATNCNVREAKYRKQTVDVDSAITAIREGRVTADVNPETTVQFQNQTTQTTKQYTGDKWASVDFLSGGIVDAATFTPYYVSRPWFTFAQSSPYSVVRTLVIGVPISGVNTYGLAAS